MLVWPFNIHLLLLLSVGKVYVRLRLKGGLVLNILFLDFFTLEVTLPVGNQLLSETCKIWMRLELLHAQHILTRRCLLCDSDIISIIISSTIATPFRYGKHLLLLGNPIDILLFDNCDLLLFDIIAFPSFAYLWRFLGVSMVGHHHHHHILEDGYLLRLCLHSFLLHLLIRISAVDLRILPAAHMHAL